MPTSFGEGHRSPISSVKYFVAFLSGIEVMVMTNQTVIVRLQAQSQLRCRAGQRADAGRDRRRHRVCSRHDSAQRRRRHVRATRDGAVTDTARFPPLFLKHLAGMRRRSTHPHEVRALVRATCGCGSGKSGLLASMILRGVNSLANAVKVTITKPPCTAPPRRQVGRGSRSRRPIHTPTSTPHPRLR